MIPEKNVDLVGAQPSQGMNRSADSVRQTCRAYVDAGRVTDEGLESIIRLFNLGKQRGYSFDQTGALVEYSGATISRLFAGKYEGALDKVVAQIDEYLEMEAERVKMRSDRFIENSIWQKVNGLCNFALTRQAIVRLVGPSQIMKLAVAAFADAVGVGSSLRVDDARQRVAKAIGRNTLLIIDELHELVMSAGKGTAMKVVEWIREIWDTAGCGMVLCGTKSLEDDLINDPRMKGWLVQLDQRCQRIVNLPNRLPIDDVMLAAEAYGIKGSPDCVESLLSTIRMNRLTSCLALTASWCAGNNKSREKHPLNWKSFLAVYRSQFEEA